MGWCHVENLGVAGAVDPANSAVHHVSSFPGFGSLRFQSQNGLTRYGLKSCLSHDHFCTCLYIGIMITSINNPIVVYIYIYILYYGYTIICYHIVYDLLFVSWFFLHSDRSIHRNLRPQVAERTLFLWNNDYIVRLITSSRKARSCRELASWRGLMRMALLLDTYIYIYI